MRKKLFLVAIIATLLIPLVYIVWKNYDLSADYNYVTAKVDIKNGYIKIINIGLPKVTSKDKEIEMVTSRYGFKNIYIEKFPPFQTEKGIKDYNEVVEGYLLLRNGSNWKVNYKREIDSLFRIANGQKN